jgi:hypothetical protein
VRQSFVKIAFVGAAIAYATDATMIIWRRYHSSDLVANVQQSTRRTYVVAVWHTVSEVVYRHPRTFARLESAKAAADDLIRRTFTHRCSLEHCGDWMPWYSSDARV